MRAITTAEQLLAATDLGRCELVKGKLVMMPPSGFRHGRVAATIARRLHEFVSENDLGVVAGAETGFQIEQSPDTVRAPDAGFVSKQRLPDNEPVGFFVGAPNLAVEVLSPGDRPNKVLAKVREWLAHGCEEVWVVDPDAEALTINAPEAETLTLDSLQIVSSQAVHRFHIQVSSLFH